MSKIYAAEIYMLYTVKSDFSLQLSNNMLIQLNSHLTPLSETAVSWTVGKPNWAVRVIQVIQ